MAGCLIFSMGGCGGNGQSGAQSQAATDADAAGTGAGAADSGATGDSTAASQSGATDDSTAAGQSNAASGDAADAGESAAAFDAKSYVEMLLSGDPEELTAAYAHEQALIDALDAQGGFAALQEQLKVLGELKSIGEPAVSVVGGYTSYSVPCEFSVQNINLVINVNSENEVGGIVTAEYTGSSQAGGETQTSLPSGLVELDVNVPVPGKEGWELPGTLTMPEGDGPFPAVILVQGSGPQDRDETIGPNKPFRDLAWGLAQEGIAVLRYDKRTYVYQKEMANENNLTLYDETIDDAVSAVEVLAALEKIDPAAIYVLGHSLGGEALPRINDALAKQKQTDDAVGAEAAAANKGAGADAEAAAASEGAAADAAGYIFMAAPARPVSVSMREQLDFLYSLAPALTQQQEAAKNQSYAQLEMLENIQEQPDDAVLFGGFAYYWKDLENYDPVAAATSITAPCLVLQGEEDYQVTLDDFSLWKDAYGNNEQWTFVAYPGLTHLFMPGQKANGSGDYMTPSTVDGKVIADIAAFVTQP